MNKNIGRIIILLIISVASYGVVRSASRNAPEPTLPPLIVDLTESIYTHDHLLADIDSLVAMYPGYVHLLSGDTTHYGRQIPVVYLGAPEAKYHVMVQASMHAREYINVQLVMGMIDQYARGIAEGESYKGVTYKDIFSQVGFVIMPSVNPDGIAIAQSGMDGVISEEVAQMIRDHRRKGTHHSKIKANARGVDLNRNFTNGFGGGSTVSKTPGFAYHPGEKPYSERETRLMLEVSKLYPYTLFLNYHSKGNLVYYGCVNAPKSVNVLAKKLATLIKSHTGYPIYGPDGEANGSWADEIEIIYNRPSATIETGDRTPVPVSQLPSIFKKNRWLWADVALKIIAGEF